MGIIVRCPFENCHHDVCELLLWHHLHLLSVFDMVLCVRIKCSFECSSESHAYLVNLFLLHRGTANPAVKPGLAAEFRLIVWLKSLVIRFFGYVFFYHFLMATKTKDVQCLLLNKQETIH